MPITFNRSERSTLGIEWELLLVDRDSNDLRQAANTVRENATLGDEPHPLIHQEMFLNTIEVTSGARRTVAECICDIRETLHFLRPFAEPLRVDLLGSGTHPFASPMGQRINPTQRYESLLDRTRYWGQQMLIVGTHVHVGIEHKHKVMPLLSAMTSRIGQMLALGAASPLWSGIRTGYASNRAMIFQQLPSAGSPYQFGDWEEYEHYIDSMKRTHSIEHINELRWDMRPSPRIGTLENRVFDASTNIFELQTVAALTQCLVEHFSRRLDAGQTLTPLPDWYVAENKWRSARHGMDATLIIDEHGNQEPVKETLTNMLSMLEPVAEDLKCLDELHGITEIIRLGAPYERQSTIYGSGKTGAHHLVVDFIRAEMAAERPLDPQDFLDSQRHRFIQEDLRPSRNDI